MYRVSDVLKPDFARSWHEAVAIVQEVASQVVPGGTVPGADDLLFDDDGGIQLGFGPDSPQNPVQALGSLLHALLEGVDAPGGLRELAVGNVAGTPSHSSVESFKRALAFYERPVRATDLQAIVARLRGLPIGSPSAAFDELRERVAAKAQAQPEAVREVAKEKRAGGPPRQAALAAAVLALAVVFAIVAYARPRFLGGRSLSESAEQKLADTISSGLDKMGAVGATAAGAPTLSEAPAPATTLPDAPVRGPQAGRMVGSTGQKPRVPVDPPDADQVPLARGKLPPLAGAPEGLGYADREGAGSTERPMTTPPIQAAPGHLEDGLVTYTAADRDVQPPRLSRQQLPRQPEPGDDTGYFDVTVNENGDVDHVTLISPMRRFQERMLMAAAKAWTFKPAMRDGRPVRYRLRIAIILSDKP